jgi:hypothetical protein
MPLPNSSRTSHAYLYWYRTKWGTIAEQGKILVEYAYYLALVVTRAPAASYLKSWVRLPAEANFSGFKGVCAFKGRWRSHRQRSVCGDFVNLEDLHSVFKDAPRNRICARVFIGMSVHALWVSQMYCVLRKVSSCFYRKQIIVFYRQWAPDSRWEHQLIRQASHSFTVAHDQRLKWKHVKETQGAR